MTVTEHADYVERMAFLREFFSRWLQLENQRERLPLYPQDNQG